MSTVDGPRRLWLLKLNERNGEDEKEHDDAGGLIMTIKNLMF